MTITATPKPLTGPPSVDVAVALPGSGAIMRSVSLYRSDNGAPRALIRKQPAPGLDQRLVTDVEAPYGVPLVYSWDSTYYDPSFVTVLYSTTWADTVGWATVDISWSATASTLTWTAGDEPQAALSRTFASGQYRVEFTAPPKSVRTIDFGGFQIDVLSRTILAPGLSNATFLWGTGAVAIIASNGTITVTTTDGTWSFQSPGVYIDRIRFVGPVGTYPAPTFTADNSAGYRDLAGSTATTDAGTMFEWDTTNRVIAVYNGETGALSSTFAGGTRGTAAGQIDYFGGLTTDGTNVYLLSYTPNLGAGSDVSDARILKYTPSAGSWVYSSQVALGIGTAAGQVRNPRALAWGNGTLWLLDQQQSTTGVYGTRRVIALSAALAVGSTFTVAPGSLNPNSFWYFAADGATIPKLYFTDSNVLRRYDAGTVIDDTPTGAYTSTLLVNGVLSMYADAIGQVYVDVKSGTGVGKQSYHRIVKFNRYGTSSTDFVTPYYWLSTGSFNIVGLHVGPTTGTIYLFGREITGTMPTDGTTDPTYATTWRFSKWPQSRTVVSPVTVKQFGRVTTLSETAPTVTLAVTDGYLIHPAKPGLSMRILLSNPEFGIIDIGEVTQRTQSTEHEVLGSGYPVVTTAGPRHKGSFDMTIGVATRAEILNWNALLDDETPLLLNLPDSAGYNISPVFVSIGDVLRSRTVQFPDEERNLRLPMRVVQSPIVDQQDTGWSNAQLTADFATNDALVAAFLTNADLTANKRVA